jgi:hypothetical protein
MSGSVDLASANAGSRAITSFAGLTLGGTAAGNYTLTGASGSVTVGKADATVVVTPYSVTYDGQPHTATVTSITGVNNETDATVGAVTLNTTHTLAATYAEDSWSFAGTANYNDIAATTITDTISARALTFTGSKTYDGAASATAAQLAFGNNVDGANLTMSGSVDLASANAGSRAITSFAGLTLGGTAAGNYTLTGASGSVEVGQKGLTITANNRSKNFGDTVVFAGTEFTTGAGELEVGDTVDSVTLVSAGAGAAAALDSYAIVATGATGTGLSNYDIHYVNGTLTVIGPTQDCPGFWSPSTSRMVVSNTFAYAAGETLQSLKWTPVLPATPAGWTVTAAAGDGAPQLQLDGSILFTMLPTSNPVRFTYTVTVPGNAAVSNSLSATVQYKLASGTTLDAAVPAIAIYRYHSADFRRDLTGEFAGQFRKIDGTEVNRVLSYWRYGYKPSETGLDGFEADSNLVWNAADGRHSADYEEPFGEISGAERDRVLAYWRAADSGYHVSTTTPDRYAPDRTGPGPRTLMQLSGSTLPKVAQTGPATYNPGQTVTLTCTFSARLLALGYKPMLPAGWLIESVSGDGIPELVRGEIGFLGSLSAISIQLTYTVRVPLTENRTVTLGGEARLFAVGSDNPETYAMQSLTLAPLDSNNNGMADAWESVYAGSAGALDPNADLDSDRMSNFAEYLCGTEPDNAASLLQMVALNVRADDTTEVSWSSVAGRVYTLQRADGTPASANFTDIETGIPADPSGRNLYTNAVDQKTPHFYRVKLQQ